MTSLGSTAVAIPSTTINAATNACRFSFIKQLWRKPKKGDSHLLAQFYREDSKLQQTVMRLLVIPADQQAGDEAKQLSQRMRRQQSSVMNLIMQIIQEAMPDSYDRREFRAKYTEEVVTDNINGALWHAVECLSYGVEIAYHPAESVELQPLATQVSSLIEVVRNCLRLHCHVKDLTQLPAQVADLLKTFDETWARFEWTYASMMCPVLTVQQYDHQQECIVLFCEASQRALRKGWLSSEMFEYMDPVLMFAIPRLAIVAGLTIFPEGPLNLDRTPEDIPQCFRVFLKVLNKVKNLIDILTPEEQDRLEAALCSSEGLCSSNRASNGQLKAVTVVVKRKPRTRRLGAVSQPDDVEEENSKRELKQSNSCPAEVKPVPRWEQPSAQELRAAFPSTDDLLQRLFVAISGIADQLQTNFASQLRAILQSVFTVCTPDDEEEPVVELNTVDSSRGECDDDCLSPRHSAAQVAIPLSPLHTVTVRSPSSSVGSFESPLHAATTGRPVWVPDHQSSTCLACEQPFTVIRRKHHCRSCGQVFCSRCSSQFVALPHLQYNRPVRVCDTCFAGAANIDQE